MKIEEKAKQTFESNPELRALFLFDHDLNYKEEIQEIESNGIQVLEVKLREGVRAKYQFEKDSAEKKYLIYCPFRRPTGDAQQQFHLIDILFANKVLSLDPRDDLIEEYSLPKDLYDLIDKYYENGLRFKKDRRPLEPILNSSLTERKLKIGLCQRILGYTKVTPAPTINETLAKLFVVSKDDDLLAEKIKSLRELELDAFLGRELSQLFDLDDNNLTKENIVTALLKFKYNLLVGSIEHDLDNDPYSKLLISDQRRLNQLPVLHIEWKRNPSLEVNPDVVFSSLTSDVSENKLLEIYGAEARFGLATKEVISAVLNFLIPIVKNQPKKVLNTLQFYWDDVRDDDSPLSHCVTCLWHMAALYNEIKNHPVRELDSPDEYVDQYIKHHYEIDLRYRKAVSAYKKIKDPQFIAEIGLEGTYQELLSFYHADFIQKLNIGWQQRLNDLNFQFEKFNTAKQYSFFSNHVESSELKTAVIISDALRYEAALDLFKVLKRDAKKELEIQPIIASVPSHTALGMSNLLPHEKMKMQSGDYCINGVKTVGTPNRKRILEENSSGATAITALEVEEMNREQLRKLFKDFNTVYIYHNLIDTTGEQRTTEKNVFGAVEETIQYIDNLIRVLNNANVYRFIVTADHGFNYLENKLDEPTLEDGPEVKGKVKGDPRFIIAEEIDNSFEGYSFPISSTSRIDENYMVALPRAVNRFRHPGVGYHYVHGGASLQEVLVPVLEINRKREERGQKVDIKLVSNKFEITTSSASIELLQVQSVGDKRNPRHVKFGFYDDAKKLVSAEEEVVFESTSKDATLRKKKILLTLTLEADELNHCTLLGFDKDDHNKLNPVVNQRYTIKRMMGTDDFGI
ncbi:MAG: BREX-1 system phosphatase PglZ type A [Gracilimonas sp.]|uniref:BREX-1 system phosphatase PglZ type A n=1 Tax=Gracilimonas sp. TaxID=1974203 RepID=UPI003752DC3D|nr:BREX-1 system phosphatase PglZ type A [Gracilimonas sp.]